MNQKHLSEAQKAAIKKLYGADASPENLKLLCQFYNCSPQQILSIAKGEADLSERMIAYFNNWKAKRQPLAQEFETSLRAGISDQCD